MVKGTLRCVVGFGLCAALVLPLHAVAGTIVTGEGLPWSGGFSSFSREAPRACQQFYDSTFFASITEPVQITGMSFRLPASATVTYPVLDLTFPNYEITMAKPSAASAAANTLASTTFADNMAGAVLVRSGSLTIPSGSFLPGQGGGDAQFSFIINFDTPYNYTPGDDVVMLVRHDGHGVTAETRWNFDSYALTNGTLANTSAGAMTATTGSVFSSVNKVQFTYVPEPATLALLGLGGLLVARRRSH